jgi:ABC-type transport system involved in cytochrome bd biosynthesis fused ATPase/permease subunit
MREIARQKNSTTTNLLIFDEIGDSSLDEDGFTSFLKIIKNESEKQNVFVISHKQEMMNNFINVLEFSMVDMFTEMC